MIHEEQLAWIGNHFRMYRYGFPVSRYHPWSLRIKRYNFLDYDYDYGEISSLDFNSYNGDKGLFYHNNDLPNDGIFLKGYEVGRKISLKNQYKLCTERGNLIRNVENFHINPYDCGDFDYHLMLLGWDENCNFVHVHRFKNDDEKMNLLRIVSFTDLLLKEIMVLLNLV